MPFMGPNQPPPPPHQQPRQVNGPFNDNNGPAKIFNGPTSLEMGSHIPPPAGQHQQQHKSSGYSVTCILFTGITFVAGIFIGIACLVNSLHRVQEGNVALYFSNGALMDEIGGPGLHMSTPFITTILQITVRPETHYLNPLQCTTSDGVVNVFREVQVISSLDQLKLKNLVMNFGNDIKQVLIYDRIGEGIQTFCANNSIDEVYNTKFLRIEQFVKTMLNESITKLADDSITVWNLFIPKPDIPPAIAANYREVKIEWTKQLVAQQKQKTERIKKQTVLQNAVLDAEREKEISSIMATKELAKAEAGAQISSVDNQMRKAKEETYADIESYKAASKAETNKGLLTDQYIKMELAKSLTANSKMYFSGSDSALGSILNEVLSFNGGAAGKK